MTLQNMATANIKNTNASIHCRYHLKKNQQNTESLSLSLRFWLTISSWITLHTIGCNLLVYSQYLRFTQICYDLSDLASSPLLTVRVVRVTASNCAPGPTELFYTLIAPHLERYHDRLRFPLNEFSGQTDCYLRWCWCYRRQNLFFFVNHFNQLDLTLYPRSISLSLIHI